MGVGGWGGVGTKFPVNYFDEEKNMSLTWAPTNNSESTLYKINLVAKKYSTAMGFFEIFHRKFLTYIVTSRC